MTLIERRKIVLKEEAKVILSLWDSYTKDMERVQELLIDSKSELAAIILQERITLHNGQSREFLHRMLTVLSLKEVSNE